MNEIPTVDASDANFKDNFAFACWSTHSSSDISNKRDRAYDGQEWTVHGERGKQLISGLTMRDVQDCFLRACLLCCAGIQDELYDRVKKETWREQDVYKIDFAQIDPIVVAQTMGCEIEKMMGIFPNVSELSCEQIRNELFGNKEQTDG